MNADHSDPHEVGASLAPAADPARLAVAWQLGYHFASRAGLLRRRSVSRREPAEPAEIRAALEAATGP